MNVPRGKHILLKKALYNLKQAARQWNMDISIYILSLGITRLVTDSYMYVCMRELFYALGALVVIVLYVDNMDKAAQNMKMVRMQYTFM